MVCSKPLIGGDRQFKKTYCLIWYSLYMAAPQVGARNMTINCYCAPDTVVVDLSSKQCFHGHFLTAVPKNYVVVTSYGLPYNRFFEKNSTFFPNDKNQSYMTILSLFFFFLDITYLTLYVTKLHR